MVLQAGGLNLSGSYAETVARFSIATRRLLSCGSFPKVAARRRMATQMHAIRAEACSREFQLCTVAIAADVELCATLFT